MNNAAHKEIIKDTHISCNNTVDEYISGSDWRIKANANVGYSSAGLVNQTAGKVIANYWLDNVYSDAEGKAHRNADLHIHDLDCLTPYCAGHSLRVLLDEGFNGVPGRVSSKPAKHLTEALGQMANFLGILQPEWAGAQAFSSFDTYLAPFVFKDNMTFKEVKKDMRRFIYNLNVPARFGQSPFTNVTLDFTVPKDLEDAFPTAAGVHLFTGLEDTVDGVFGSLRGRPLIEKAAERGCKSLTDLSYKHFQPEMEMICKAFYEVLTEGDSNEQPFTFPIPTVNITEDFNWDSEAATALFENTAKVGNSYFQNFLGSQYMLDEDGNKVPNPDAYSPDNVRSMCVTPEAIIEVRLRGGKKTELKSIGEVINDTPIEDILLRTSQGFREVEKTFKYAVDEDLIKITLEDGASLTTTKEHPHLVYTGEKILKIVKASMLAVGMGISCKRNDISPNKGVPRSDEVKQRISKTKLEGYASGKYKRQCGEDNSMFGKEHSEAAKAKISATLQGHPVTDNCRAKSSERWEGLKNPVASQDYWDRRDFTVNNQQISPSEKLIYDELVALDTEFTHQKVFLDADKEKTYVADFYIPEKNMVIEIETSCDDKVYINEPTTFLSADKFNHYQDLGLNVVVFNAEKCNTYRTHINRTQRIIAIEEIPYKGFVYDFLIKQKEGAYTVNDFFINNILTHNCCRLQLDLRELLKRGNGLFGSAEMTGSIGVVTINMARLGYTYKDNYTGLIHKLDELLIIAKDSLEKKRVFIQKMYDDGLYPYTKRYLPGFNNHFSTIGVNGMNEMLQNFNWQDTTTEEGIEVSVKILKHIRGKLREFQESTGNLYNLEATPAEGTTYRFAKEDLKKFGEDIIQAGQGDNIYYTNSSQLPANHTEDPFEALLLQDKLQTKYTGGTVLHLYMSERIDTLEGCKTLVKTALSEFKLPYITITPVFSVCEEHGYLKGEQKKCPTCDADTLVWTRVMGYHRPVASFNLGKQGEHAERVYFKNSKRNNIKGNSNDRI